MHFPLGPRRPERDDDEAMKPTAVVIGGTHGAGKSTLGELLSQRLGWPLISRDRIRGGLAWTTGEPEHEAGGELSRRAVAVFFETLLGLTKASVSVVAESPFRRGLSEADIEPVVRVADVRYVQCRVPRDVAIARCEARYGREFLGPMLCARDDARWLLVEEPLELRVPVLNVDTADGYEPGVNDILRFATDRLRGEPLL